MVAAFLLTSAFAASSSFYEKRNEGWYAYEKDKAPDKNTTKPKRFYLTPENLSKLSASQFKDLLENTKSEAVMNPSPENVRSYIILQNYSMGQAEKFEKQFKAETLKDATLDPTSGFQTSTFAHGIALQEKADKREDFFKKNKDKAGFIVFFDSKEDPAKLKAQKNVADYFETHNEIKTIFVDLQANPGMRQANKISATPDVWIVIKQDDGSIFRSRVSTGVSDRQAILEGIDFVTDQYLENKRLR